MSFGSIIFNINRPNGFYYDIVVLVQRHIDMQGKTINEIENKAKQIGQCKSKTYADECYSHWSYTNGG